MNPEKAIVFPIAPLEKLVFLEDDVVRLSGEELNNVDRVLGEARMQFY